ncbi:MAG: ABC transporter substrate-binding protein [Acidobacteria bacterium]|nr:ABC transporter substrate-binding protein [Acidobacteriota bacterium]
MDRDASRRIVIAHSPDSDDAFMFYGMATQKVRSSLLSFHHVLEDIESLNRAALEGRYEMTAISYHAYPFVADKYVLTSAGSSVGDGYGPIVVARHPYAPEELKGKRIGIPGARTTSYLALKLFQPDFQPQFMGFDKVLEAVQQGGVDAGLIIHEGQVSFDRLGVNRVVDLGRWWKESYGLPLPLGANAVLRSLDSALQKECCRVLKESIEYALEHREEALSYAMQFARGLDSALTEKFVGMYVNHYTLEASPEVKEAAAKMIEMGYQAGLIPHRVTVEFV